MMSAVVLLRGTTADIISSDASAPRKPTIGVTLAGRPVPFLLPTAEQRGDGGLPWTSSASPFWELRVASLHLPPSATAFGWRWPGCSGRLAANRLHHLNPRQGTSAPSAASR